MATIIARRWSSLSARAFLIEPDQVAGRVAEGRNPGITARLVGLWRLHDFASMGRGLLYRGIDVVHPDGYDYARFPHGRQSYEKGAAHVSGCIVEAGMIAVAAPDI